jgi:PST family polysaccharide transporter
MIVAFSQAIWDAGLSKALIRLYQRSDDAANIVFWTNTVLALLIYFVIFAFAPLFSSLFHEPRAIQVIRVQGVQIIILSLTSVHVAILQRDLNFRDLFMTRIFTPLGLAIASIPLALAGLGYWALVAGTLTGSLFQSAILWAKSSWRPSFSYNLALAKEMFSFGVWITAESLLAWFYLWVDTAIVGAHLSSSDLGLYKTGDYLVNAAFGAALAPLVPVMFTAFARLQRRKENLTAMLMNSTIIISVISIPLGVGLFMTRSSIESFLFPNSWLGLSAVIGLLALLHGCTWINSPQIQAFRAVGKPDVNTKIMLFGLLYSVPLYLISIRYGLLTFIWVRLACAAPTFLVRLILGSKFFDISWLTYFKRMKLFFLILALASSALWIIQNVLSKLTNPFFTLFLTCLIGAAGYTAFVIKKRKQLAAMIGS